MKKVFVSVLIFIMSLLLIACGGEQEKNKTVEETTDISKLTADAEYEVEAEYVGAFALSSGTTVQGSCFVGDDLYIALVTRAADGSETVRIQVTALDGTVKRTSGELMLDHANNMTYIPEDNRILVTHCQDKDGANSRYSKVNPDTFEITQTGEHEYQTFAMAYDPVSKRFASGRYAGETLDVWDKDLCHIGTKEVEKPYSLSQGVFCDENGIYFVRSYSRSFFHEIRVYDWELNLKHVLNPTFNVENEPESILIKDGKTYIVCNGGAGFIYSLNFKIKESQV